MTEVGTPGLRMRPGDSAAPAEDAGWSRENASQASSGAPAPAEPLTERELEILRQVAEGKSNKQIAGELVISTGTVKTHTNNLYRKLGAQNRTEAVRMGRHLGLL